VVAEINKIVEVNIRMLVAIVSVLAAFLALIADWGEACRL
jgi:hypothetical protein